MKAMILAAGRGERMRPLTDHLPKPLLKVAGKMLIEYHLEKLKAAEIIDVVINHAWQGEKIEQALGNGSRYGLTIHYSAEAEALETAGGIIQALPLLGDGSFIGVNGDIFCDYDFSDLALSHSDLGSGTLAPGTLTSGTLAPGTLAPGILAHLIMVDNPGHHPEGDFVLKQSGRVEDTAKHKLTFSGIGLYHPDLFTGYETGKRALSPVLCQAMSKQQVTGEHYRGIWHDIGTAERLHALELSLNNR